MYKFFEVTLIDILRKAIIWKLDTAGITKHAHNREMRRLMSAARKSHGRERLAGFTILLVVLTVRPGEGAILSSSTVTANVSKVCKILT